MIITSDFHIHSEYSYDARNPLSHIVEQAKAQGLCRIGITDHLNFNDEKFIGDLHASVRGVTEIQRQNPFVILGVELTPIEKPEFDHIALHHTREGYVPPIQDTPYAIELAMTKEELRALGVRYAVGAAHWRVDCPHARTLTPDLSASIREWHRQQMFLATDERVTILGHPWYHGKSIWYEDFSVIPGSMHEEFAAALKENGKFVECNSHFFALPFTSEKFRHQYAEYLRFLFEAGIPVTYGSDSHNSYEDHRLVIEKYLRPQGFTEGDFYTLTDADLC